MSMHSSIWRSCALLLLVTLSGLTPAHAEGNGRITIRFTTGGDDLRGGNVSGSGNNANFHFLTATGRRMYDKLNVNRSQTWGNSSEHTVVIDNVGAIGDLKSFELSVSDRVRADVFESTDNWHVAALRITISVDGAERVLFDGRGAPLRVITAGKAPQSFALQRVADSCGLDSHCNDGLYCNGEERCLVPSGAPRSSLRSCVAGTPVSCSGGLLCSETSNRCVVSRVDEDGDGDPSLSTGGSDCDDRDPKRFAGNPEICDSEGHDEDCDFETVGLRDIDRDGHNDAACFNWGPPPR